MRKSAGGRAWTSANSMPVKRLAKEGEQGSESRSQRRIVRTPVRARARVARQAHAIAVERADATDLSSSASSSTGWPVWIVCILSCWLVDWRSKKGECEKYSSLHRRTEGGRRGMSLRARNGGQGAESWRCRLTARHSSPCAGTHTLPSWSGPTAWRREIRAVGRVEIRAPLGARA
jgi:hypothetical protein